MPRQSLAEYLSYFERYAGDMACAYPRGYRRLRVSYRELARGAAHFARRLEGCGIEKGDRVLIWGENCAEWILSFWGCMLRGAVVVPIDRVATAEFAARVAAQVQAKLVLRSSSTPELPAAAAPSGTVPSSASSSAASGHAGTPAIVLEELFEGMRVHSAEPYAGVALTRGDVAEIVFTSGTTAEPKGVVLTHGNLLANLEPLETEIGKYRRYERFVHPLRFLNLLPLSHVFGQFMGLLLPPLLGAEVIFLDTLNPAEVIRTIRRERVSVLVAVPHMLDALREKLERDAEAAGGRERFERELAAAEKERFWRRWWRFRRLHARLGWKFWAVVSGGATLAEKTETFWSRLGLAAIQGYGLTETASLVSLNHPFQMSRGSIGKSLPGRELKLAANGEILVRGESIATAYWQGNALQPVAGEEGWFHTGDAGAIDEKGNLYFKGRLKNVLVSAAGMNVYPEDLEAALRKQPEVRDAVVVGVSRDGNEEACAVLLLRPGADAREVVRRANESLAEYQKIRHWMVWAEEDFPRTTTQKPRTSLIRAAAEAELSKNAADSAAGAASGPLGGNSGPESALESLIKSRWKGRIPPHLRNADLTAELNLSSLDRVELLSAIEDRFQIELDEGQFSSARTIEDLERLIRRPAETESSAAYPSSRWAQRRPVQWLRVLLYYLLAWPATMLLAWPRVKGRENLRATPGPALFIANHVTEIDAAFVLAALPARYRHRLAVAMVGERLRDLLHPRGGVLARLFGPVTYALVTALFNVFPMPKQSGVRGSFQYAGESIDRGYSVLVFPEGQLTRDGEVGEFRSGIGVLATRLGVPVVPMRIEGLYELRQAGRRLAPPGTVRITIGEPMRFPPQAPPEEVASTLRACVQALCFDPSAPRPHTADPGNG